MCAMCLVCDVCVCVVCGVRCAVFVVVVEHQEVVLGVLGFLASGLVQN